MTEQEICRLMIEGLREMDREENDPPEIRRIITYEEGGVLTRDAGMVVTMRDGAEYQITIIQSKRGRQDND